MDQKERLLRENADLVFRLALRLTGGCHAEAEDIAQEALIAAFTRLPRFAGRSRLSTWLHTITVRTWRRRMDRAPQPTLLLTEELVSAPGRGNGDLNDAICSLPPFLREAFVLVKVEGWTSKEAAKILDIPQGTVQWRVHESCQRLRVLLLEEEHDHDG